MVLWCVDVLAVSNGPRQIVSFRKEILTNHIQDPTKANHILTGSIYLSRTSGGAISEDQAREILNKQGPIEKLWYPTDTDKEVYRLPDGIWATFAFFQDARDAQNVSVCYVFIYNSCPAKS